VKSTDFDLLLDEYERHFPGSPFLETWIPRQKFLSAEFDGDGSISISREDRGVYGVALGPNPIIGEDWKSFSIESGSINQVPATFTLHDEWDCYWAPTIEGEMDQSESVSDSDIEAFLRSNAPKSSVFPGGKEIIQWVQILDGARLIAVAALCRWESGRVVISSVATDAELRGKGLGKELMRRTLIAGHQLGEKSLSLGVMHQNESAQRLYSAMGFKKMHNFSFFERR
jgi:ribosomal protein S18 acetylase RimI-like enzyme